MFKIYADDICVYASSDSGEDNITFLREQVLLCSELHKRISL